MLKQIVVALALVTVGTQAQAGAVDPRFQVNTHKADRQDSSKVAALKGGGFVVVWCSNGQDGSSSGVYGQKYTGAGGRFGKEFRVNSTWQGQQSIPSIAPLAGGGFVVVWPSDNDGDGFGIYGQRFEANGVRKGGEFRVNRVTRHEQKMPRVAGLYDGGFVVVWNSYDESLDSTARDVFGQRFDSTGQRAGGEFKIASRTESYDEANFSTVAALANGGFVVTWISDALNRRGVYARRYASNGLPASSAFTVARPSGSSWGVVGSNVIGLKNGTFLVTWSDLGDDNGTNRGTYGQIFFARGTPVGARFLVGGSSLTPLANGGFVAAWSERPGTSPNEVHGQRFAANGRKVGAPFEAGAPSHGFGQGSPALAGLRDGGFVLTWTDDDPKFETSTEVYGQRFNP
jgi:hypothetical protein